MKRIMNMAAWRGWTAAAAIACLSAAAAPARAADGEMSHFTLGPRAMYFDPKDADEGVWSGGAQARFHFNESLGLEGSIDYRRSRYGDTLVHTYPVQATLLMTLVPNSMVRPFILGGAGWYFTSVDGPFGYDDTDNRFGLHAGGGLEVALNESWSVDGTYRYVWLDDFKTQDAALFQKEYNDSGSMVTVGLNYHFQ